MAKYYHDNKHHDEPEEEPPFKDYRYCPKCKRFTLEWDNDYCINKSCPSHKEETE